MKTLIQGSSILGINFIEEGEYFKSKDLIIAKDLVPSATLVDLVIPPDWYNYYISDLDNLITSRKDEQPTPEPTPQSITPRQIRLQLTAIGMRQAVEDYVASAGLGIKDWWEFSLAYERNAPLLVEAATALGMTSEQLDQFFVEANKL